MALIESYVLESVEPDETNGELIGIQLRIIMLSWEQIEKIYRAVTEGDEPPVSWQQCLDGILDYVKSKAQPTQIKTPSRKQTRDQLLVVLSILLSWLNDYPKKCLVIIPVVDLSEILVSLLLNHEDKFVWNLATRCLCSCLTKNRGKVTDGDWYVQVLSPCISSLRTGGPGNINCVLDLFRLLFSKKALSEQLWSEPEGTSDVSCDQKANTVGECLERVRSWCLSTLTRLWRPLVEDLIKRIPSKDESENQQLDNLTLVSLLSLWVKLIKYQQTRANGDLLPSDMESFAPLQTTTRHLLHAMTSQPLTAVTFDKMADVLNRTLLYGCGGDQFQYGTGQVYGIPADLAADVLSSVQTGLLDNVPHHSGFEGFGGTDIINIKTSESCQSISGIASLGEGSGAGGVQDVPSLRSVRKVSLIILKACAIITKSASSAGISTGAVEIVLSSLWSWAKSIKPSVSGQHWVVTVYGDQDDGLVEAVLCLLDVYLAARPSQTDVQTWSVHSLEGIDPHEIFLHFLDHCSFDHSVLLDLLTSPETCFLLYFVRYLHHMLKTWTHLCQVCLTWQPINNLDFCTPRPQCDAKSGIHNDPGQSEKESENHGNQPLHAALEKLPSNCTTCTDSEPFTQRDSANVKIAESLDNTHASESVGLTRAPTLKMSTLQCTEEQNITKSRDIVRSNEKVTYSNVDLESKIQSPDSGTFDNSAGSSESKTDLSQSTSCAKWSALAPDCKQEGVESETSPFQLVAYSDNSNDSEDELTDDDDVVSRDSASSVETGLDGVDIVGATSGDSVASDLGMSLTTSATSLTSVTSDLEMPSELLDVGMETEVEDGILDQMMAVMIRLRLVIERLDSKGLFPYNAAALKRLLCEIEGLYEGEDQPS